MEKIPPLPNDVLFYSFISGILVAALTWIFKFIGRRAEKRFDIMVASIESLANSVNKLTSICELHEYRLDDYEKKIDRIENRLLK